MFEWSSISEWSPMFVWLILFEWLQLSEMSIWPTTTTTNIILYGNKHDNTKNNTRIETMILVHENKDILTHNSGRFLVVCNFVEKSFTLRASVSLPKVNGVAVRARPATIVATSNPHGHTQHTSGVPVSLGTMPGRYKQRGGVGGSRSNDDDSLSQESGGVDNGLSASQSSNEADATSAMRQSKDYKATTNDNYIQSAASQINPLFELFNQQQQQQNADNGNSTHSGHYESQQVRTNRLLNLGVATESKPIYVLSQKRAPQIVETTQASDPHSAGNVQSNGGGGHSGSNDQANNLAGQQAVVFTNNHHGTRNQRQMMTQTPLYHSNHATANQINGLLHPIDQIKNPTHQLSPIDPSNRAGLHEHALMMANNHHQLNAMESMLSNEMFSDSPTLAYYPSMLIRHGLTKAPPPPPIPASDHSAQLVNPPSHGPSTSTEARHSSQSQTRELHNPPSSSSEQTSSSLNANQTGMRSRTMRLLNHHNQFDQSPAASSNHLSAPDTPASSPDRRADPFQPLPSGHGATDTSRFDDLMGRESRPPPLANFEQAAPAVPKHQDQNYPPPMNMSPFNVQFHQTDPLGEQHLGQQQQQHHHHYRHQQQHGANDDDMSAFQARSSSAGSGEFFIGPVPVGNVDTITTTLMPATLLHVGGPSLRRLNEPNHRLSNQPVEISTTSFDDDKYPFDGTLVGGKDEEKREISDTTTTTTTLPPMMTQPSKQTNSTSGVSSLKDSLLRWSLDTLASIAEESFTKMVNNSRNSKQRLATNSSSNSDVQAKTNSQPPTTIATTTTTTTSTVKPTAPVVQPMASQQFQFTSGSTSDEAGAVVVNKAEKSGELAIVQHNNNNNKNKLNTHNQQVAKDTHRQLNQQQQHTASDISDTIIDRPISLASTMPTEASKQTAAAAGGGSRDIHPTASMIANGERNSHQPKPKHQRTEAADNESFEKPAANSQANSNSSNANPQMNSHLSDKHNNNNNNIGHKQPANRHNHHRSNEHDQFSSKYFFPFLSFLL